jgi:hypothetical protein
MENALGTDGSGAAHGDVRADADGTRIRRTPLELRAVAVRRA